MALDIFSIQDMKGNPIEQPETIARLRLTIDNILSGETLLSVALGAKRSRLPGRASVFKVQPAVIIDNNASRTHTVIEVNGRDRIGFLYDVTAALYELGLKISSAHNGPRNMVAMIWKAAFYFYELFP